MTWSYKQFAIALVVCSCLFLPACNSGGGGGGKMGGGTYHTVVIKIVDTSNNCQQSIDGGSYSASPVTISYGDSVTFSATDPRTAFVVTFPSTGCGSPFQSCTTTFNNGAPTGTTSSNGLTFPYSSVTIGTPPVACNNPGQLGLIMK